MNFSSLFEGPVDCQLNYQKVIPGKDIGRYIDQEDKGDIADVHLPVDVTIKDGRKLVPASALETRGFELKNYPTGVKDFFDDEDVTKTYYPEVEKMIKESTGASKVIVFDHTVRKSTNKNLNNMGVKGASAAAVPRVHCDYTKDGAPRRFQQLAQKESYTGLKLDPKEVDELSGKRFAFINVWRNCMDYPVSIKPLAVCDVNSVDEKDHLLYELRYPDRTGENYSLDGANKNDHDWYYYPQMTKDEALMFFVYDKKEAGPRFVMHSAFDHPETPDDAPERVSLECRAIACFEDSED